MGFIAKLIKRFYLSLWTGGSLLLILGSCGFKVHTPPPTQYTLIFIVRLHIYDIPIAFIPSKNFRPKGTTFAECYNGIEKFQPSIGIIDMYCVNQKFVVQQHPKPFQYIDILEPNVLKVKGYKDFNKCYAQHGENCYPYYVVNSKQEMNYIISHFSQVKEGSYDHNIIQ